MKFAYDANGRMIRTSNTDDTNQANSVYDAIGERVATRSFDVWKFFIYDVFGKLVAEYGGLDAPDEGGVKYVFSDLQGSTRAVLSNSGFVQARADFIAFGEEINAGVGLRTATQGFGSANNLNQKYALTERDTASGLDHTWWRKLENRAGRWTSPDPYNGSMILGNPQSFNRYAYVGNEPTNLVDPTGLCGFQIVLYDCYQDANGKIKCKSRFILDAGNCIGNSNGRSSGVGGGGLSRYQPYQDSGSGLLDRNRASGNNSFRIVDGFVDKNAVYKAAYSACLARKAAERGSTRATAILSKAGVGCFSGGASGSFYGASGGGLVGFVFGGVGAAPGGVLGGVLGSILGCSVGATLGIVGQITVGQSIRDQTQGNPEEDCDKEASNAANPRADSQLVYGIATAFEPALHVRFGNL